MQHAAYQRAFYSDTAVIAEEAKTRSVFDRTRKSL
jgi:hypothetical protein